MPLLPLASYASYPAQRSLLLADAAPVLICCSAGGSCGCEAVTGKYPGGMPCVLWPFWAGGAAASGGKPSPSTS